MSKVHKIVADKIIEQIKTGLANGSWKAPWDKFAGGIPLKVHNGQPYRGTNVFMLWFAGFNSPYWGTLNQWNKLGATIKKGQRSHIVVYCPRYEDKKDLDKDGKPKIKFGRLRYFKVFNAEQVEGWEAPNTNTRQLSKTELHQRCDELIQATGADITHGGSKACYIPATDQILLPEFNSFKDADAYYQTAFHELAHWTGADSRMDRDLCTKFGSQSYALEELLAEMSAAIMCATMGLDTHTRMDHAQYAKHWIEKLEETPECLTYIARNASEVVDYLLDFETVEDEMADDAQAVA